MPVARKDRHRPTTDDPFPKEKEKKVNPALKRTDAKRAENSYAGQPEPNEIAPSGGYGPSASARNLCAVSGGKDDHFPVRRLSVRVASRTTIPRKRNHTKRRVRPFSRCSSAARIQTVRSRRQGISARGRVARTTIRAHSTQRNDLWQCTDANRIVLAHCVEWQAPPPAPTRSTKPKRKAKTQSQNRALTTCITTPTPTPNLLLIAIQQLNHILLLLPIQPPPLRRGRLYVLQLVDVDDLDGGAAAADTCRWHCGYEKPRLRQFSSRSGVHAIIILRLFGTLLMSTVLGFSLNLIYLATHPLDSLYFSVYSTGLITFWGLVLGQLLVPAAIKISDILDIQPTRFHRSHVSHMRMDRIRRSANYRNDRLSCCSLYELAVEPLQLFRRILISPWYWVTSAFVFSTFAAHDNESSDDCGSDRETSGQGRAFSEADSGIRVTVGKGKAQGLYVDEVVEIQSAPEYWCVPQSDARRAYIFDLTGSPECLGSTNAPLTVDGFIKKQCRRVPGTRGEGIPCRRSNLTCGGFYTCSFAEQGHPRGCARWDDDSEDVIAVPIRAAKSAEAKSLVAIATQFYESVMSKHCNGAVEEDFPCGGHAVLCKFLKGRSNGKAYFIGCSNWTKDDDITHRFTKIPAGVRESILRKLFRGEALSDTEDDVVTGPCTQITHSANLPNNKLCPRTHFRDGQHVRGTLSKNKCPAKILILIPIDGTDLRTVVIPQAGTPHNHPLFPRSKVPFEAASKYKECITATGPIGTTTLRVDKSSSTRNILDGRLPQEIHPSLINNRRRRDMVHKARLEKFPAGTGMQAVWTEFEKEKSRPPADRYIHAVNTRSDETHVIITMNPDLAALTLDASWIMVDTTFVVVHGKTNEWMLLIWLDGLEKSR
ncbi:hypothetical protein B0H16DRAFT_1881855 [Mycena metata]|uniref:Uncharacterized protein n=1 Tax=Mycena metata TaxID=1033252 RepID=A0AAD7JV25_9AGAR|nr:hypothetical protein B0H16DRAFT_1881855 [Mycena metata]